MMCAVAVSSSYVHQNEVISLEFTKLYIFWKAVQEIQIIPERLNYGGGLSIINSTPFRVSSYHVDYV